MSTVQQRWKEPSVASTHRFTHFYSSPQSALPAEEQPQAPGVNIQSCNIFVVEFKQKYLIKQELQCVIVGGFVHLAAV